MAPAIGLDALELVWTPSSPVAVGDSGSARARAAVALAREMARRHAELLVPREGRMDAPERGRLCGAAVEAAEEWVICPCERHGDALTCLEEVPINDCVPECCWYPEDYPGQMLALALNALAECAVVEPRCRTWFPSLPEMLRAEGEEGNAGWLSEVARIAIRAELLPWALEQGDPLAERVRARAAR